MTEIKPFDVFLCHNGEDKPFVEALAQRLEAEARLRVWLDKWHLIPGEPWQEGIEKALDQCRTYAVFLGPSGIGPWQHEEMRSALDKRVKDKGRGVIPVLLPGSKSDNLELPSFIARFTWVDLRRGLDDQDAFHRLVAGIKGIPPGPTSSGDDLGHRERTLIPPDTGPPHIEDPQGLLPPVGEPILKKMFADDYQRVVIKREFGRGLSGSRVFLVRPIRNDGSPELPAVIKMGPTGLIKKEWQAYQANIRNKLPNVAEIQDEPILSPDGTWSGLRYRFIGKEIESLYSYCRQAKVEDLRYVLARLFKKIEPNYWRAKKFEAEYLLQAGYDFLLPINLIIDPSKFPPAGTSLQSLGSNSSISQLPSRDDYVRLAGFEVTEADIQSQVVTLNLPASAGKPRRSCRLRLQPVGEKMMGQLEVGQALPIEVVGQVTATRRDLLEAKVKEVLGPDFDLATDTVSLPNGTALRNPLSALSDILKESRDVYVASIHGDLNLENILVNRETRDVSLIDFATARWDHVLHDLLRLETEVVTKLIPAALAEAGLPAETIHDFYQRLHEATFDSDRRAGGSLADPVLEKPFAMLVTSREKAKSYLYDPDDPTEYYQGLVLYLLGALKFKNLDDLLEDPHSTYPKQVAFWAAATLVDLLNSSSPSPKPLKTEYAYDVFISYSQADIEWVQDELLPLLEAAGLKVFIDFRDFVPGGASLTSAEQGVGESRHTLVVLTPAWIESEWTEFESILAGTSDPAGRRRRVVPLILSPCQPPPRIAMLVGADLTNPSRREQEMARLLRGLGGKSA